MCGRESNKSLECYAPHDDAYFFGIRGATVGGRFKSHGIIFLTDFDRTPRIARVVVKSG